MSKIRINPAVNDAEGGYMARTMSRSFLASAPITAWTQFFHKPYKLDWKEAKDKAVNHCRVSAIISDSLIRRDHEVTDTNKG